MSLHHDDGPFSRGDVLLEQFEITRLIGVGGHAYVYECRDQFLDELLAVKVIPNPPNRGRELLDRARAEAQLLRKLSHPNVVRMHTAAALRDDMVCLVMEKLDGVSLRHLLALLSRLFVVEALTIIRQAAVGVGAAHQLDVVHRDIKPDNIFVLPPDNHVKVLDFGIAKFLGRGLQTSNKHRFQGTPLYMSPEHLKGAGVTVRSDVYQLGTVLFELLAGINPNLIDFENPTFDQVAFVQITRPTPPLTRYAPNVPAYVDQLVQKATAKESADRFGSMAEFIQAIDWSLAEYLNANPEAPSRVRYVDAAMVAAAKKLEVLALVNSSHSITEKVEVAVGPVNASATLLTQSREAPLDPIGQNERVASFHPVPFVAGKRVSVQPASNNSAPRHSAPPRTSESHALPIGWMITAIASGLVAGVVALWTLIDRSGEPAGHIEEATGTPTPVPAGTAPLPAPIPTVLSRGETEKPRVSESPVDESPGIAKTPSAPSTPVISETSNAEQPPKHPSRAEPRASRKAPVGPILVLPVSPKPNHTSSAAFSTAPASAPPSVERQQRTPRVILGATQDESK
ncbi:MAG: protein kinase domain-containing protein [Myxococcales bacterium]